MSPSQIMLLLLKDSVKLFFQGINDYVDKNSETTDDEPPPSCKYVNTDGFPHKGES